MTQHRGRQPRVVSLFAKHLKFAYQFSPRLVDGAFVAQHAEQRLPQLVEQGLRIGRRHPKPVLCHGPRSRHPELVVHLRNDT